MLRRSLLALIAMTAALPVTRAFAEGEPRKLTQEETDLINAVSAHNSAISTMSGRFLQVDTAGQRIEGTFYLQRPGKIRFRYAPPSHEEIMSIGRIRRANLLEGDDGLTAEAALLEICGVHRERRDGGASVASEIEMRDFCQFARAEDHERLHAPRSLRTRSVNS